MGFVHFHAGWWEGKPPCLACRVVELSRRRVVERLECGSRGQRWSAPRRSSPPGATATPPTAPRLGSLGARSGLARGSLGARSGLARVSLGSRSGGVGSAQPRRSKNHPGATGDWNPSSQFIRSSKYHPSQLFLNIWSILLIVSSD